MDKQYPWKRTEDIEIDLPDLFRRLCRKWKQAVACAVAGAVILGGYGWMRGRDSADAQVPDAVWETELTEEERHSVAAAVQLEKETSRLEEYLENSVLMQIDPYHKDKAVMLYSIDHAQRKELPKILESYLSYVINGGAAVDLKRLGSSIWEMDKSYLAELVTAYQKTYSSPYQIAVEGAADGNMEVETLFYVEITGKDAKTARQMAKDMQKVLIAYSAEVMETAGSHKFSCVSSMEKVEADSGLQSQQHDKKALLASNRANLKAMTDAFGKGQMSAYKDGTGKEEVENKQEEGQNAKSFRPYIKYILLGFAGGAFAYCSIFACWYLLLDTVKSIGEMKKRYSFPFYGGVSLKTRDKNAGRMFMPQQDACCRGKAQMLNRIRLACKKQEITKLCAASDFIYDKKEKDYLEDIAGQLKRWGIDLLVSENASIDTSIWDELSETGKVLLVCRIGTTTHRMIDDAMNFYLENNIDVLGAIAFD